MGEKKIIIKKERLHLVLQEDCLLLPGLALPLPLPLPFADASADVVGAIVGRGGG